jgi:hypothetical protein
MLFPPPPTWKLWPTSPPALECSGRFQGSRSRWKFAWLWPSSPPSLRTSSRLWRGPAPLAGGKDNPDPCGWSVGLSPLLVSKTLIYGVFRSFNDRRKLLTLCESTEYSVRGMQCRRSDLGGGEGCWQNHAMTTTSSSICCYIKGRFNHLQIDGF